MKKQMALLLTVAMIFFSASALATVEVPSFLSFAGEEAVYLTEDAPNGLYLYQMESAEAATNWANLFISELQYAYDFENIQTTEGEDFYYVWLQDYTGSETLQPVEVAEGLQYYVMCMVGLKDGITGKVIQCISPDLVLVDEFVYE